VSTDTWNQINFPSSDITVIQLNGNWGKLTLFNIYNKGNNNKTILLLTKFHQENRTLLGQEEEGNAHIIWLSDFNRHHPHWDDPNNTRLFTGEAVKDAEVLIEAVAEVGLDLALLSGIPMHLHNITKKWSRLNQVFLSDHSENLLITCNTQTEHRGINTDHLPIWTELNLKVSTIEEEPAPNFCEVDWDKFGKALEGQLEALQPVVQISMQRQLDLCCKELTIAIQEVIHEQVPKARISPKTKRWWTKELTQL
jgi:Endonuclease-reverse transcriptase